MIGNFFKSKAEELAKEYAKFNSRETAEAMVAVMLGVASADGEIEKSELEKIKLSFTVHPILKMFDQTVLMRKFTELGVQFQMSVDIGQQACLDELEDVVRKDIPYDQRVAILRLGVMTAKADGEVEPAEREFLQVAADVLGVRFADLRI